MPSELQDVKLTAYALGELDEAERQAVEAQLGSSEEARQELAGTRAAAAILREALAAEPRHELSREQRQAVETEALRQRPRVRQRSLGFSRLEWGLMALAAGGIMLAIAIPSHLRARMAVPHRARTLPLGPPPATRDHGAILATEGTREQLRALGYSQDEGEVAFRSPSARFHTDAYDHLPENPFVLVAQDPRSTFSVDVDTASYSIVRRYLNEGQLPPKDAVRIEELVNYFPYRYAPPADDQPFAVHMDAAVCPWQPAHRLVRIALKGREIPPARRPPANLVFLLDVSGSMDAPDKLPLAQAALRLLVQQLGQHDRIAVVVYAGAEGLVLPSTRGSDKAAIREAIDALQPGGATHGSAGLRLAYETARAGFIQGGVNRVVLASDGDFNVGITSQGELVRLIEQQARTGVSLTVLGFGMGNLKDSTLEKLADHGNGNYAYVDSLDEARKVLVEQLGGTLVTIAQDVKLQVEFNPRRVQAYRLIGYENRALAHQDFEDDRKDAGEIGAGHTVTALYELVPPGDDVPAPPAAPLKYQQPTIPRPGPESAELLTLRLRYKQPGSDGSRLIEAPLGDASVAFEQAQADFRFAAAVAGFGLLLRESPHRGDLSYDAVLRWARGSLGAEEDRTELVGLVERARALSPRP